MLYNLLYPLSVDYSILNIFKYITFRSAWALVTALAVSILVGPYFIRWLQADRGISDRTVNTAISQIRFLPCTFCISHAVP